MISDN